MGLTIRLHQSRAHCARSLERPPVCGIRAWKVVLVLPFGLIFDFLGLSALLSGPLLSFGLCCLALGLPPSLWSAWRLRAFLRLRPSIHSVWRLQQGWLVWQERPYGIRVEDVCQPLALSLLLCDEFGLTALLTHPLLSSGFFFGLFCLVPGLPLLICGIRRLQQGWPVWQQRRAARRTYRILSAGQRGWYLAPATSEMPVRYPSYAHRSSARRRLKRLQASAPQQANAYGVCSDEQGRWYLAEGASDLPVFARYYPSESSARRALWQVVERRIP